MIFKKDNFWFGAILGFNIFEPHAGKIKDEANQQLNIATDHKEQAAFIIAA